MVIVCFLKQEKLPTNTNTAKYGSAVKPGPTTNSQPQQESNVEKARRNFHAVVAHRQVSLFIKFFFNVESYFTC